MMKKVTLLFTALTILTGMFFSFELTAQSEKSNENHVNQNYQKIWNVDSQVYKYLSYLYVLEGRALPNSAGPWSTEELKQMLAKVEPVNIENEEIYNQICLIINASSRFCTEDGFHFTAAGEFSPEMYIHSNSTDFTKESDWIYDFEKRQNLLNLYADAFVGNNIYAIINCGLGYASYVGYEEGEKLLYAPVFMSNIPFVPVKSASYLSVNFPDRAFISFGGEHWNLSFGRDVLRWGNGETGNLFLGGNSIYDNNLRFSAFYNNFKFSGAYIFYPHNKNLKNTSQNEPLEGLRLFMAHRMDFRFLKDRICLGLSEGVMYQSAGNTFNLSYFNPMNLFHNYYIRGNSNSIMAVDLDFAVLKGLNFYGQFALDEASSIGEPGAEAENGWRPSKYGYLAGVKYVLPLGVGVLKINGEGVYTDPYLYLREKYDDYSGTQGLSLYGDVREFQNHTGIEYIRNCIGYGYGGDCIVGEVKAIFDAYGKWNAGLEFFYMAHGIIRNEMNSDWMLGEQKTPSTEDGQVTEGTKEPCPSNESGKIENLFNVSIVGDYAFFEWLKVYSGMDNIFVWNKGNKEAKMVYDFQMHLGVKMDF